MSMKISIAISLIILSVGAVIGMHDRQQLAALRVTQENLSVKAAILGVSADRAALTSRNRTRRTAIAKRSIAEVLAIANQIRQLGSPNGLNHDAIMTLNWHILDELSAWDVTELKALLAEIHANSDLDEQSRHLLSSSCSSVLAHDHPQAALILFTSSPELYPVSLQNNWISTALASWARNDHIAAIAWLEKNPQHHSLYEVTGILSAVAEHDPQLAFRLLSGELKLKDGNGGAIGQILNSAKTLDQKTAALAGLREYLPTTQTGDKLDLYRKSYLSMLTVGMEREGFDDITRWISDVKLTPQEMNPLLDRLTFPAHNETGKWIEWMRKTLPADHADDRIGLFVHAWVQNDYKAAAQWAESQPKGKDRKRVLEMILGSWPERDLAGKAAFAKEHPLE